MAEFKSHKAAWAKLTVFATSLGIEIVSEDEPGEAAWVPSRNVIKIDPDLEGAEALAALLHELGHALDQIVNGFPSEAIERAYANTRISQTSIEDRELMLKHETDAWRIGRALAKRLKIRLGRWFDDYAHNCIKLYVGNAIE